MLEDDIAEWIEKPGNIEVVVRLGIMASRIDEATVARDVATLHEYLPEWKKHDNGAEDLAELVHCLERKIKQIRRDSPDVDYANVFPLHIGIAIANVILGTIAIECRKIGSRYFGGLTFTQSIKKLISVFVDSVEARRKGGKATKKWTPEIDELAREMFADVRNIKVSNDAVCRRIAARIKSEHGVSISAKTVKRHLFAGMSDNA